MIKGDSGRTHATFFLHYRYRHCINSLADYYDRIMKNANKAYVVALLR